MEEIALSFGPFGTRQVFVPKRAEPEFHPLVAPPRFVLALAERAAAQSELLAARAERMAVVITETDYCPLG